MQHRKINILHMIETTGPGGAETVLLDILRGLNKSDFESVVTLKGRGWLYSSLEAIGITPMIVESSGAFDWRFLRKVARIIRGSQVDLIHSHLPDSNFYACIAGWLTGIPVIVTYHGMVGNWSRRSLKNRFKMAVIKATARRVVVVSEFLKGEMVRDWAFRETRLTRIYNGVDFKRFEGYQGVETVRSEFGIPGSATLVCSVGNIRKPKGYEYLLQAARLVTDRFPETYFLIAGQGQGTLLEELQVLRKTLGLEQRVHLAGFREDIPAILKSCDIFVLSSVTEGLSIATIEAMALGRPVVVTDSGGPSEIVQNGIDGLVVRPGDASAMAEGICRLVADRGFAQQLGANALPRVRERFNIEDNIRNYVELYRNCLQ